MALNIEARVTDLIDVKIIPAQIVLCVSCKEKIGRYLGKGRVVDDLGNRMTGKCPLCNRNWLACVDGLVTIKTEKELIKC